MRATCRRSRPRGIGNDVARGVFTVQRIELPVGAEANRGVRILYRPASVRPKARARCCQARRGTIAQANGRPREILLSLIANMLDRRICDTRGGTPSERRWLRFATSVMPTSPADQRTAVGESAGSVGRTYGAARRLNRRLGRAGSWRSLSRGAGDRPRLGEWSIARDFYEPCVAQSQC